MKISKIIKGIVRISVVSGIAYASYKYGEFNGKNNQNAQDEDFNFYDDEDEEFFAVRDNSEEKTHEFKPFSDVKINDVSEKS